MINQNSPFFLMHYLGGKKITAKDINNYISSLRSKNQLYIEPFVGGLNTFQYFDYPKIGYDIVNPLISLYRELIKGWIPPDEVDEAEYSYYQEMALSPANWNDPMIAFVGFGCSFSGKWFGGYARGRSRNYAYNAKEGLLKKIESCKEAQFYCKDYRYIKIPENSIVYCDPPYNNTTIYNGAPPFNTDEFWDTVRKWKKIKGVSVYVSEHKAPKDFKIVKSFMVRRGMGSVRNHAEEFLFV